MPALAGMVDGRRTLRHPFGGRGGSAALAVPPQNAPDGTGRARRGAVPRAGARVRRAVRRVGAALAVFRGFSGGRPLGMDLRSIHRRSVLDVPRILAAATILARGLYSVSRNCTGHGGMGCLGALHMGTYTDRRLWGTCPSAG